MRIGIDIRHLTSPEPAGVGGYTLNLLDALFRLDQKNEYVLFASGTQSALARLPSFNVPNVTTAKIPLPNKILNASLFWTGHPTLESVLANHHFPRPDIWFFPNLNFIQTNLPYAVMCHDVSFRLFPEFFTPKSRLWHQAVNPRRIFKNAQVVLCPSTSTKQDLMNLYGLTEEKIHAIPLAASLASTLAVQGPRLSLPPKYILSLATLEPRKNHCSLIKAYNDYRVQTGHDIALVIAGGQGWKSQPILKEANHSPFAKDIHLIGYVSAQQKAALYAQADCFVFPSFYEGFGLPVLEAMAAGCPVITSNTSSLPELTAGAAILVDPFNINDLSMAIKLALSSQETRSRLIEKGSQRAKDFSWEETARKTLDVLKGLML